MRLFRGAARFLAVLLEQATQIQLGPHLPVRVNREGAIGRALQVPADNFAPIFTTRAALALPSAWTDVAGGAAGTGAAHELPAILRNPRNPGIVAAGNESSAVEADNIEPLVIRRCVEGATDYAALAVVASLCDTNPIIDMRRRTRRIAQRLVRCALMHDEVAGIVHGVGAIGLDRRQRTRHRPEARFYCRDLRSPGINHFANCIA